LQIAPTRMLSVCWPLFFNYFAAKVRYHKRESQGKKAEEMRREMINDQ